MLGVRLDPMPIVAASDPDYHLLYEAVTEKATDYFNKMHGGG